MEYAFSAHVKISELTYFQSSKIAVFFWLSKRCQSQHNFAYPLVLRANELFVLFVHKILEAVCFACPKGVSPTLLLLAYKILELVSVQVTIDWMT